MFYMRFAKATRICVAFADLIRKSVQAFADIRLHLQKLCETFASTRGMGTSPIHLGIFDKNCRRAENFAKSQLKSFAGCLQEFFFVKTNKSYIFIFSGAV